MFTVFEKVWDLNGTPTFGAYGRAAQEEAVTLFHKKMGTDMNPEVYSAALVMVFDDNGAVYRSEKWSAPIAEPVAEPAAEE